MRAWLLDHLGCVLVAIFLLASMEYVLHLPCQTTVETIIAPKSNVQQI